jgi:transposase-like protein
MEHQQILHCPHCDSVDLVKNGHSENGTQRWRCSHCRKSFLLDYRYNARKPGVKAQIVALTLSSSGVRDVSRVLGINRNTVMAELKKTPHLNPYLLDRRGANQLKRLEVSFCYAT